MNPDTAYSDTSSYPYAVNLDPYYDKIVNDTPQTDTHSHVLNFILVGSIFAAALSILLVAVRYNNDPDYRKKLDEENRQREEEKQAKRRQRQRALDSMSTTERLLYEQNKELRRFHWYITLRDLFAPRRRR